MALTISSISPKNGRPTRGGRFVTDLEARQAAHMAGLDYSRSSVFNSSRLPARVTVRWANQQPGGTRPATRPKRDRAGPVYVVGVGDKRFDKPVIHSRWRRLQASRSGQTKSR